MQTMAYPHPALESPESRGTLDYLAFRVLVEAGGNLIRRYLVTIGAAAPLQLGLQEPQRVVILPVFFMARKSAQDIMVKTLLQ